MNLSDPHRLVLHLAMALALYSFMSGLDADLSQAAPLTVEEQDGIAIEGYDPVAFHVEARPIKGAQDISLVWLGVTWHFANAENRDLFAAEPFRYVPQYGGYCAPATSDGRYYEANPQSWAIVDGKLYLNYSKGIHAPWQETLSRGHEKPDAHWATLQKGLAEK